MSSLLHEIEAELDRLHADLRDARALDDSDEAVSERARLMASICTATAQQQALQGDTAASLRWARLGAEWQRRHSESRQAIHDELHAQVRAALRKLDRERNAASALAALDEHQRSPDDPEDSGEFFAIPAWGVQKPR